MIKLKDTLEKEQDLNERLKQENDKLHKKITNLQEVAEAKTDFLKNGHEGKENDEIVMLTTHK